MSQQLFRRNNSIVSAPQQGGGDRIPPVSSVGSLTGSYAGSYTGSHTGPLEHDDGTHTSTSTVPSLSEEKPKSKRPHRTRQLTDSTMIISNRTGGGFFSSDHPVADPKGPPPPISNDYDDEEPQKSQSCGRGIVNDYRGTVGTYWKQEMFNFKGKTIAVTLFLFFACIAPAITFGAIYSKVTHNYIGTVEMLVATAWCGIFFALAGGQPVMINGGTGPVLAFTGVLYKLSETIGVPFLAFNAWCGLWVCIYMLVAAFVDLNRVIRYATRFTDEIFALLIAAIFIINAIGSPFHPIGVMWYFDPSLEYHEEHEDDESYNYMETALLSFVLCFGTTALACFLRGLRHSTFLWNSRMRSACSDFAITISIVVFTFVDQVIFPNIETEKLKVPTRLQPSFVCCTSACEGYYPEDCPDVDEPYGPRPWFVDLGNLNGKGYVPIVAAVPAMLAFILIFLDDGITKHLMNHPCHKLTHGTAYNYDTVIIGLTIAINSMLGLPWLVAATVRSLNHLHALADKSADGKTIYSVLETRLTGLFAHVLILCSLFALSIIQLIPVPVLYGVFLYMGVTTLGTNQFWNRLLLFLMEPSMYEDASDEPFVSNVTTWRIHYFTGIQLFLFALLYTIKSIKVIAIAFPVVIAACIPIRMYLLPRIFTYDELVLLDSGDDAVIDKWLEDNGRTRKVRYIEAHQHDDEEVFHQSICGDYPYETRTV